MCVVCGCSDTGARVDAAPARAGTDRQQDVHFGLGEARVSVPGMSQTRAIQIERNVLSANNSVAAANRARFAAHGVAAFNLVSSPGSGKTTLLCATLQALRQRRPGWPVAVIEGDQQTSHDADRIRATGAPAIQINTGKGCHLDAPMVAEAFDRLHDHFHHHHHHDHGHAHGDEHAHDQAGGLLFIENVGNLVCPALWDLGEAAKVAILSVTEGEDKPLKYPDMFAAARLMLLNKIDLLPHLSFDVARCVDMARRVNPGIEIIQVSATTGQGLDDWLHWIEHQAGGSHGHGHHAHPADTPEAVDDTDALKRRIRELEAELARARSLAAP